MTLPASGPITAAQIRNELGISSSTTFVVPTNVRKLTGVSSGPVVWPTNFHSKKGLFGIAGGTGSFHETNTETIAITDQAAAGDVAVLFDMALSSTSTPPTAVSPSGFSGVVDVTGTGESSRGIRVRVSRKILTGGDPGSILTGMNGSERNRKIITIIRPVLPIASVTEVGWSASCGSGAQGPINIGSGNVPNCIFLGFGASQGAFTLNRTGGGTWTDSSSDDDGAIRGVMWCATKGDSPASQNISMTDGGDSNGLAAGILNLTFTV